MVLFTLIVCMVFVDVLKGEIVHPFTQHFVEFLKRDPVKNKDVLAVYQKYGPQGTFGGKDQPYDKICNQPILFIHGNEDSALYLQSPYQTGWNESIVAFKNHGYNNAELYGMSYGDHNLSTRGDMNVNCELLKGFRRLAEAILDYTKAGKLDLITHSMGVTIGRRIIKGGKVVLPHETCDLGAPLTSRVDAFVGLGGANYGLCLCFDAAFSGTNSCNKENGFYAGRCGNKVPSIGECLSGNNTECNVQNYGTLLKDINENKYREGAFVASVWGGKDEIIGPSNLVWGRTTSHIPNADVEKVLPTLSHYELKNKTMELQFNLVTKHSPQ